MRRNYKILLLGTGESGKSTFFVFIFVFIFVFNLVFTFVYHLYLYLYFRQVNLHEEPQSCPWFRLLYEGETRRPWSELECVALLSLELKYLLFLMQVIVSNLVITVYLILCQMDLKKVTVLYFLLWTEKGPDKQTGVQTPHESWHTKPDVLHLEFTGWRPTAIEPCKETLQTAVWPRRKRGKLWFLK